MEDIGLKGGVMVGKKDLKEDLIARLKHQGWAINFGGVGTMLVTAYDQPALGGVYKLSAIRKADGTWDHKIKLSEQTAKVTNPGVLQVRRFREGKEIIGDAIYDETRPLPQTFSIVDPIDATRRKHFSAERKFEDLLVPILRHVKVLCDSPSPDSIPARAHNQLAIL